MIEQYTLHLRVGLDTSTGSGEFFQLTWELPANPLISKGGYFAMWNAAAYLASVVMKKAKTAVDQDELFTELRTMAETIADNGIEFTGPEPELPGRN